MNTSVAASAPLKTTSRHGPEFPPPSHQLSLYRTSFGSIPSRSVRNRGHSSPARPLPGGTGPPPPGVKTPPPRRRATIGYRRTRVWPFDSMNERKSSRIARGVRRFLNGGFPRKSYSWHGVSPQVEWSPRDQKNFPHEAHWIRRYPCARNSSTSNSPSGIPFANLERDIKVSGRDDAFRRRPARLVWSTPTAPA